MTDVATNEVASPAKISATSGIRDLREQLKGRLLVVYDGECGFCNRSIRWLLRRDAHDRLRFAPSSHLNVRELLANHGIPSFAPNPNIGSSPDTILVFFNAGAHNEKLLLRSNAILACMRVLPQPWPFIAAMAKLIPRLVRESAYRTIARWRYRIWGRHASCPIPTPKERTHFL